MKETAEQQGQNEAQCEDSILCLLEEAEGVVQETQVDVTSAKQAKPALTVPDDKPKRPQSAYNIYFQLERENIIKEEDGKNYTIENIARVADDHYWRSKIPHPKRKVRKRYSLDGGFARSEHVCILIHRCFSRCYTHLSVSLCVLQHRKSHGKISFGALARVIANRWKALDVEIKRLFEERAEFERERYKQDLEEWTNKKLRGESEVEESPELYDKPKAKPKASSPRAPPGHSLVGRVIAKEEAKHLTSSSPVSSSGPSEQPRGVTPGSDPQDVESFMAQEYTFGHDCLYRSFPFLLKSSELHSSGQGIFEPTSCCVNSSGDVKLGQTQSQSANSSSLKKMTQPSPCTEKRVFNSNTEEQTSTPRHKVSDTEEVSSLCIHTDNKLKALPEEQQGEPISTIFWPVNNSTGDDDISDVSSLCSDEDESDLSDEKMHIADMIAPSIGANDDDEASVISISCID